MRPASRRRLLVALGAAAIVAAVAWALAPRPVPVDVLSVARGPLAVTVDEEGETRVRERFVVSAPVAGRLLRVEVEPGDPVAAGTTVVGRLVPAAPAPLDSRSRAEAEARMRSARATTARARAEREAADAEAVRARSEADRSARLAAEQIVSADRHEAVESAARAAEERREAARFAEAAAGHDLEAARAALMGPASAEGAAGAAGALALTAPVDGMVLRRLRESEAVVPAGEPLLEIGDPADLEIVSDLLSTDAVRVRAGAPVAIEQWGGGRPLAGRVRRVEPAGFTKVSALGVEEQRVNVLIDFADPHEAWRTLGDAYRVEVAITVWQTADALLVPVAALFRHGPDQRGWAVYAVAGGRARVTPIELGERNRQFAEVHSGLAPGATVIVHPGDQLTDGARVAVRGE